MQRLTLTLLTILLISTSLFAQWKFHDRKYAEFTAKSSLEIQFLVENGYHIDNVKDLQVYVYLNAQEIIDLQNRGYDVKYIPDPAKEFADQLWELTKNSNDPLDDYHSFDEFVAELETITAANPGICRMENAGYSVQGRELWVMKISDNVNFDEDEPEFMYISTMHGDEPVGTEMCMYLINYLVDNYPEDPQVRYLIDETDIFIMPWMNPDGTMAHSRYNANGFDLNRTFPDRIEDPFDYKVGRPQEVQVIMEYQDNHSPVLSANFHTGALLMNYPYDSNPNHQSVNTPTPDDDWFIDLSLAYSIHNQPMYNGSFPQGISNGAAWYAIYGGLQDWCYEMRGRADVTIELSDISWPPPEQIPGFWEDNRESMLAYMEKTHTGIRGLASDFDTGEPIPAIITLEGNSHEVYTDPEVGDYYRLTLPGVYTLNYYCYGYESEQITDIAVIDGELTRVDVQLRLAEPGYIFDDLEGSTSGFSHAFVTASYSDQWHLTESKYMTPTHSWKCGDSGTGNYMNSLDAGLVTPVYNLLPDAKLSFWHYIDSEVSSSYYPYAYDGGLVEIRMTGSQDWEQIEPMGGYPYLIRNTGGTGPFPPETPVFAGYIGGREAVFDLTGYEGEAQFRFRFGSDGSVVRDGWYIDDIEIESPGGAGSTLLEILVSGADIELSWEPIAGVTGYNVYRTIILGGTMELLSNTADTTLTDYNVLNEHSACFYEVRGVLDLQD